MSGIFLKLLNLSISASWLVLVVLALRLVLKRAPKWVNVLLWGMVALRLMLPFSIESALSLIPSAETLSPEVVRFDPAPTITSGVSVIDNAVNPSLSEHFAAAPLASVNPLYVWTYLAGWVWLIGLAAMLLYALVSYLRLRRRVSASIPLWENIYVCDEVPSPFILGIVRPRIYLPSALDEAQIPYEPHPWLPGCFLVSGTGNLETLPLFQSGAVYVQDPAAKLAALASGAAPGMRVLDCCAAPGGKSFAAAMQMENTGSILSCDLHPHKIALIEKNAARLGISILKAETRSAAEFDPALENGFDLVIADVPCSGLGVIRKKPDIRYKPLDAIERLPAVQTAILENVCRYVRPGGTLLYSTCTVRKEENEDVARTFLLAHPEFSPEPFAVPAGLDLKNEGYATLLPQKHAADGFFICKLRRHA